MAPDQLWITSMNPETRILRQVSAADAEQCANMIDICLGEQVTPRKELIMKSKFSD